MGIGVGSCAVCSLPPSWPLPPVPLTTCPSMPAPTSTCLLPTTCPLQPATASVPSAPPPPLHPCLLHAHLIAFYLIPRQGAFSPMVNGGKKPSSWIQVSYSENIRHQHFKGLSYYCRSIALKTGFTGLIESGKFLIGKVQTKSLNVL